MSSIMVVGGAGYIGSHAARELYRTGRRVIVYDNLSRGHQSAVKQGILIKGELEDKELLVRTLKDYEISAVMHFAAHSQVGESQAQPAMYYENNVAGTLSLLSAMREAEVNRLVFSSTAAVYGQAECPIGETASKQPTNVYGRTKWMIEQALADYSLAYGLNYVALRYFNAAGADPDGDIGEDHAVETHLIPIIMQVLLGQRKELTVFGDDYATPDGTCIRDYIHVTDLALAHLAALDFLETDSGSRIYNLGNGDGFSVLQIIDAVERVTGRKVPYSIGQRREGDPDKLIADSSLITNELEFKSIFGAIEDIVESAWRWHNAHPRGYDD